MNLYHDLANAKDLLRQAKDYYETARAVVEMSVLTLGKNAEDRKRELTVATAQDVTYQQALAELRRAEYAVDTAQALIDQTEAERREHEWAIRARLAEALSGHAVASEDDVPDWLQDRQVKHRVVAALKVKAQSQMDELYQK